MTKRRYVEIQLPGGGWGVHDRRRRALVGPDGEPPTVHSKAFWRWTRLSQRDAHDLAMELNG